MSTLAVVEDVLRKARIPLSVPQIVTRARGRLSTKAKRPELVVARDLALSLRRLGDESPFARTAPGRFTLRDRRRRVAGWQGGNLTHRRNAAMLLAIGARALPESRRVAAYATGRVAALLDRAIAAEVLDLVERRRARPRRSASSAVAVIAPRSSRRDPLGNTCSWWGDPYASSIGKPRLRKSSSQL